MVTTGLFSGILLKSIFLKPKNVKTMEPEMLECISNSWLRDIININRCMLITIASNPEVILLCYIKMPKPGIEPGTFRSSV